MPTVSSLISFFVALFTMTICLIYLVTRYVIVGAQFDLLPLLALGVSWFLVFAPHHIQALLKKKTKMGQDSDILCPWFFSEAFVSVAMLIFVYLLGLFSSPVSWALPVISGFGGYLFLQAGREYFQDKNTANRGIIAILAVFLGLWISAYLFSDPFMSPVSREALYAGKTHIDLLFFGGMANMLDTYHLPSAGISGLTVLKYHFASLLVYTAFSKLFSVDFMKAFTTFLPLIFVPLYLNMLLVFTSNLFSCFHQQPEDHKLSQQLKKLFTSPLFWLIIVVSQIGILPASIEGMSGLRWFLPLSSPSYNLAIYLMLVTLTLTLQGYTRFKRNALLPKVDYWFWLLILPVLFVLVGLSKVSVIAVLIAVYGLLYIRLGLFKSKVFNLSAILIVLGFVGAYSLASPATKGMIHVVPFSLVKNMIRKDKWIPVFVVGYFLPFWVFLGLQFRALKIHSVSDIFAQWRSGSLIGTEILLLFCLISFVPANIIPVPRLDGVYFADIQHWVCLPVLLAALPTYFSGLLHGKKTNNIGLYKILVGFFTVVVVLKTIGQMVSWAKTAQETHTFLSQFNEEHPTQARQKRNLIMTLENLNHLPQAEKRTSALFVSQEVKPYWDYFLPNGTHFPCISSMHLGPAIAGLATLDGNPPLGCPDQGYGYGYFHFRSAPQTAAERQPAVLCKSAVEQGFEHVIILQQQQDTFATQRLSCSMNKPRF